MSGVSLIGASRFNANPTAAKPVTVDGSGGAWTLRDPAHDPAGFLTVPGNACWPVLDEPLRSSLPAIFDGGVMTCPSSSRAQTAPVEGGGLNVWYTADGRSASPGLFRLF